MLTRLRLVLVGASHVAVLALAFSLVAGTVPATAAAVGPEVKLTKSTQAQFQAADSSAADVALAISTPVTAATLLAPPQTVTVTNTTNVTIGTRLSVEVGGANPETVIVSAVPSATQIIATFAKTHAAASAAVNTNVAFGASSVSLVASNSVSAVPSTTLPAAIFAGGAAPTLGRGAHAVQGQNGLYLIVNGGCAATTTVYDSIANTFSPGPALATAMKACTGAFSIETAANTFLVIAGGRVGGGSEALSTPLLTSIVTATATGFTIAAANGPAMTDFGAGAGAHAIKRAIDGRFVVVHGGGAATTTLVTAGATPTAAVGPGLTTGANDGAVSLPRPDGNWFTLPAGTGGNVRTTNTYTQGPSGTSGAFAGGVQTPTQYGNGAGGHAIQYTDAAACPTAPNLCYRVVIGGSSNKSATYDPAGTLASTTLVASTTISSNAGAGAFSRQRADGSFLIFLGGGGTVVNTMTSGGTIAGAPFPAPAAVGAGAFALQKANGDYLEFAAGGTAGAGLYDPGFRFRGVYNTEPMNPGNVDQWTKAGWAKNADPSVTFRVRTATSQAALSGTVGDVSLALAGAVVANAAAQVVAVTNTVNVSVGAALTVDAGASLELVTVTAVSATSFSAVFAKSHASGAGVTTVAYASTLGLDALTSPATLSPAPAAANKWIQVQVVIRRPIPVSGGAQADVWLGSDSVAFPRTTALDPTLTRLELYYNTGQFVFTAGTTAKTAGAAFGDLAVTLRDSANAVIADYTGTHVITFSGASPAPDGTAPTAAGVAFGAATSVTFAAGSASPTFTLYRAESLSILATEATGTGSASTYTLTSVTMATASSPVLTVVAGTLNTSLAGAVTSSPAAVAADGVTTSTITVNVTDTWKNPIAGRTPTLASSRTGGVDVFVQPGTSGASGIVTGTVRSSRAGLATITATDGVTFAAKPTVDFRATQLLVTTQNAQVEVAGTAFSLTLTATGADGIAATNYTTAPQSVAFASTATTRALPVAGVAPTIAAPLTLTFNASGVATTGVAFTLTNSGQTPTITATDAGGVSGTSAAITVNVGAFSAAESTVTATPTSVAADNATTSAIAVRAMDASRNPLPGKAVVLATNRSAADTLGQPAGVTDANGLASGTVRSGTRGVSTLSATAAGAAITQTATVTFTAASFAVIAPNANTVTANVPFTVHLVAMDALGNIDTTYTGSKTINFTSNATTRAVPKAGVAATIPSPQTLTFASGAADSVTQFTLTNSGQTPTITATGVPGPTPMGTSVAITVQPNVIDAAHSEVTAAPKPVTCTDVTWNACVRADGATVATVTVKLYDVVNNPLSGRTVVLSSSRGATDTVGQPAGTTDASGVAAGTIRSVTIGDATVTASASPINPAGLLLPANAAALTVSQTVLVHFTTAFSDHFTVTITVPGGGANATAGAGFQVTVTAKKADGTTDTGYCVLACTLRLDHTATAAPDGTAPTPATATAISLATPTAFTAGVWSSSAAYVTFYRAQTGRTITITDANDPSGGAGTTPAFDVLAGATSQVTSALVATPRTVAADGTSSSAVRATVLDRYRNPRPGTVTITTNLGVFNAGGTSVTLAVDAAGQSAVAALTSGVPGVASLASAGILGTTVYFTTAGYAVAVGSYFGENVDGALTKYPLEVTAVCGGTCNPPNATGAPLPTTTVIQWSYTSTNGGVASFDDATGAPAGATVTTTGAYGTVQHRTALQVTKAGSFCVRAAWQNPDASTTTVDVACASGAIVGLGVFDITSTANGVQRQARATWNGTTLRILGWWTR
ncbi:MAG: beta strand repeat-containing protein [Candidatus Limnocylindria bacterium]